MMQGERKRQRRWKVVREEGGVDFKDGMFFVDLGSTGSDA